MIGLNLKTNKQRIHRAMDIIQHVCKITHDDWYEFFEILTAAEKQANQDSVETVCSLQKNLNSNHLRLMNHFH